MKKSSWGWFRSDFGLAGVAVYVPVIILANLDKDFSTIMFLGARQALVTFFLTSALMGFVLYNAKRPRLITAYGWGVLFPAVMTAVMGFIAHWYFTNEYRNVLAPFTISLFLNATAVILARMGHVTFLEQTQYVLKKFK